MILLYFLIPLAAWLIIGRGLFGHHFSGKEMLAQAGLSVAVLAGLFLVSDAVQMGSTQLVNGEVTATRPVKKSCPSGWVSYADSHCTNTITRTVEYNCGTDSKGNRSCSYRTEYRHIYPWERRYFVDSNVPETFEITRVDRQGVKTPPRFSQVQIGEPVTVERYYRNYVRAAAHTLFKEADVDPAKVAYPKVFDYYRADRVIYAGEGVPPVDIKAWNRAVSELNRDLRPSGANIILVLTDQPEAYGERLAKAWAGHNINDLVVAIGLTAGDPTIQWVDVRSWSAESLVNIEVKDAVLALGTLDPEAVNAAIRDSASRAFRIQDPEAFAYLKDDIAVPTLTLALAFLFLMVATPALTLFFARRVDWR